MLDCHVHAWSGPALVAVPTGLPARPVPLGELQAVWQGHGVDGGVIVQPSWLGTDNAELVIALTVLPATLRGVAVVSPESHTDLDLATLNAAGVRAIRFNTTSAGPLPDFRDRGWQRVLAALDRLGWHIEALAPAPAFAGMAEELAALGLPLMFDHFAMPEVGPAGIAARMQTLETVARKVPVSVKLSAPYNTPSVDHVAATRALTAAIGADRLVLGSNFPFPRHEATRNFTTEWQGIQAISEAAGLSTPLLSENARRLYRFPTTTA